LNYPFLTKYERDTETALDFAQARYYSSGQGGFTSVDPVATSAKPASPQTFNRYSYVSNSPLNSIDPTGTFGIRIEENEQLPGKDHVTLPSLGPVISRDFRSRG
jgi:RHS repeat-associated protein